MLAQFTVENFLSFKDETVFSMLAADEEPHRNHIIKNGRGKKLSLLRAAALYGANASGKSNLIKAIAFARNLIVNGTKSGQTIGVIPFKLSKETLTRPSRFEFIFKQAGIVYSYGFKLDSNKIYEEWLFATQQNKEELCFKRKTSAKEKVSVQFGDFLIDKNTNGKQFLEFVAQSTRPNQLFLTEAADKNVKEIKPVFDWFNTVLMILYADSENWTLERDIRGNENLTNFLTDFLQSVDTSINQVSTEEISYKLGSPAYEIDPLLSPSLDLEQFGLLMIDNVKHSLKSEIRGDQVINHAIKTQHLSENGVTIEFDFEEESEGTQRLMNLLPALFELLNNEKVILIDELDRRLHPLLSRMFVETALAGKKKSQMIFTTHDTNLLDLDLLRRDEIWFVEKDKSGASHLYSLAEFKLRPDLPIQKGYLQGRFGAIPFIGDISRLT
jgi:uncharacterized protein